MRDDKSSARSADWVWCNPHTISNHAPYLDTFDPHILYRRPASPGHGRAAVASLDDAVPLVEQRKLQEVGRLCFRERSDPFRFTFHRGDAGDAHILRPPSSGSALDPAPRRRIVCAHQNVGRWVNRLSGKVSRRNGHRE